MSPAQYQMTKLLLSMLFKAALDHDLVQLADVRASINRSTPKPEQVARLSQDVDSALIDIASYCKSKGWPPLHALFVKQPHMTAGIGFFRTMGVTQTDPAARLVYWKDCVSRVYQFFDGGNYD